MVGHELINPMERTLPVHDDANLHQREQIKPWMTSPSSGIIGEGAAIFTDMTEMILDVLDKTSDYIPWLPTNNKRNT